MEESAAEDYEFLSESCVNILTADSKVLCIVDLEKKARL